MDKISIIMGIYNCEDTIKEALDSIINQTYKNWELIMCDDGSTDRTYEIALLVKNKYPDKIKILKNEKNMGLNFSLNRCLKEADGKYIARMDSDDRCLENRLEIQIEFLKKNKEFSLVGSNYSFFDENGVWGEISLPLFPTVNDVVLGKSFAHPTILMLKEAIEKVDGYSLKKETRRSEDYDLWCKLYYKGYRGANIDKNLYLYRENIEGIKKENLYIVGILLS